MSKPATMSLREKVRKEGWRMMPDTRLSMMSLSRIMQQQRQWRPKRTRFSLTLGEQVIKVKMNAMDSSTMQNTIGRMSDV